MTQQKILITTGLPYANGDLHLGHIIEQTQADIWARFQRLQGNMCYYICGEDAHGTPVMLLAEKLKTTPEALIKEYYEKHLKDSAGFLIHFDAYGSTHSEVNHECVNIIYKRLKAAGHISTKTIEQAFDPEKKLFLPDRFIKGTCPRCGAEDQYGDNCEECGATYSPMDLKNPRSVLTGVTPVSKPSEHFFFEVAHFEDFLRNWVQTKGHVPEAVANKLQEWFQEGLHAWDISRDAPYFGFQIPDAQDKYFYVWLDAPVGYMSAFKTFCDAQHHSGVSFNEFWEKEATGKIYHFIGKDVAYFHSLFWPAMLKGADFQIPSAIYVQNAETIFHPPIFSLAYFQNFC